MRYLRLAIVPAAIAVCGFVSACSYHKTVETAPERVVQTEPVVVPAPATVVETVPAPAPVTSSTTTTTTTDNGIVEKQKTTTYTTPGY